MPKAKYFLTLFTLLAVLQYSDAQHAHFVDPFLGSDGGGNTFPGATLPFGMLKAGPDTGDNTANAGWTPDQLINGFSQTHVSGTGGGAKYGNVLVQPTAGEILPQDLASARSNERAMAGYYGVTLTRHNIGVEVAAARRSALYRFVFPASTHSNILIDAGHCLSSYARKNEAQSLVTSSVEVLSDTEIAGSTSVTGGWNQQPTTYTIYFYAVANTPAEETGTWRDGEVHKNSKMERERPHSRTGAWLRFHTQTGQVVQFKIGISFLGKKQAKRNARSEIAVFDFARARSAALDIWDKALEPISLDGASEDDLKLFYTAIYHSMLMPTDRTGENPQFHSHEPAYDDFYAIWDTFRTSSPLLTLIAESRESGMVRSLLDLYTHEGWLPDARSGNYNGRIQGGSDADMTIVDGYLKHLPGVNWDKAYKAVVHDAEETSPHPLREGRGDLRDWRGLGYLSIEGSDRPASKSMEYAANDYAIALFAKGRDNTEGFHKYFNRAENWHNLWDKEASVDGFTGFIWPRHSNGTWKTPFDPLLTGTWNGDNFYEGNSWTYSTYVPQDVAGLISASGGSKKFVDRMDAFFKVPGRYDVGNEPGFLAPYLYLWASRPDRTQIQLRTILAESYHSGTRGLPGNDDSGAISSWYVFGKIGFYPNSAQDVYLVGSPAYPRVTIHLANGHDFIIETDDVTPGKPYIASATWDGHAYQRCWFTHEQLIAGGTLRFTMSATPTTWGAASPPPSLSTP